MHYPILYKYTLYSDYLIMPVVIYTKWVYVLAE